MKAASGCLFSVLLIASYRSLSARSVSACGGMYTAITTIAVNSLGSQNGRHRSIRYSRSREQKDMRECTLSGLHQALLTMKHTPPPLLFPVSSFVLSARNTENPGGSMAWSGISSDNQVSVKHMMLQSLVSRWKEILALNSHSLLSRDCTLASRILGSGGRLARRLSLTSTPARLPLLLRRFFGSIVATLNRSSTFTNRGSSCRNSGLGAESLTEGESGSLKKKKKKAKKSRDDAWRPERPRDPFAMLDALPEEKQQEIQRALHLFSLGQGLPKTLQEAKRRTYRFWDTQPVPKLGDEVTTHGPIEEGKASVREEPYSLPQGFSWDVLDLTNLTMLRELCTLLNENYTEEDDNTFRYNFSPEYLQWVLQPPGWLAQWHCGVRVNTNKKLVGFIAAVPTNVRIYDTEKRMVRVNFLCVHRKLRLKRMSPVLIRELTRRVGQHGLDQAVYTAGVVLPTPLGTCRYWHRSLNPRKLMDVNYPLLRQSMSVQRALKLNRLPEATKTPGLRPMTRRDVPGVHGLLQGHLCKFHLSPILSAQEVEHWLLPRERVIYTYVVESGEGVLTAVVSFSSVWSMVMNHPVHSSLGAAHCFYCLATSTDLVHLMEDMLVLAKAKGFDVFTALDVMENKCFLEKLKLAWCYPVKYITEG